jgi:hypothetical protein
MIDLDKVNTIGILGDRHTGKTNLMFYLASSYKGQRQIIFYGYPKATIPYSQIHTISELEMQTDKIIFMDELQKHIKFYDRRMNGQFLDILSTLAHNRNTLVFNTQMSQYITKALDCFLDGFIYTRISDLAQLKNASKAKRLLQGFSTQRLGSCTLRLDKGEYLQIEQSNGLAVFPDMNVGKDWASEPSQNATKTLQPREIFATATLQKPYKNATIKQIHFAERPL